MNPNLPTPVPARRAFTLIELLVVIAIIGILAGMVLVGGNAFIKKGRISRTQAELGRLATAIDNYKVFKGVFPPDGKKYAAVAPLYYELMGTVPVAGSPRSYKLFQGDDSISEGTMQTVFGRSGFVNASTDPAEVKSFLPVLKDVETRTNGSAILLVAPVEGPAYPGVDLGVNPWCYVSSNPTNNRAAVGGGYDLWADISIRNPLGGYTTYRICNWQRAPIVVP